MHVTKFKLALSFRKIHDRNMVTLEGEVCADCLMSVRFDKYYAKLGSIAGPITELA